ncbi:MAG TPA: hypothetical protein DCW47_01060, partial [Lachnospiraceae bacterium]|nr:hypothetical protein [Lachnospiraceae bacterium]
MGKYDEALRSKPFQDYNEYMEYVFDSVNMGLDKYITGMKTLYAAENGGYKNVLYPDIEVASDMCKNRIDKFYQGSTGNEGGDEDEDDPGAVSEDEDEDADADDDLEEEDDELLSLLGSFGTSDKSDDDEEEDDYDRGSSTAALRGNDEKLSIRDRINFIEERAKLTEEEGIELPFYRLCKKMKFEPFTIFCFAAGILSSTQTDYAAVYQVINENGNLPAPTIESAAKAFYGSEFSITGAYGDMSTCLEQLLPLLSLSVTSSMPFSTVVSPDKRIIDCLFGR